MIFYLDNKIEENEFRGEGFGGIWWRIKRYNLIASFISYTLPFQN